MERDDRNANVHYDEHHGQGGSFIVGTDGKRVRSEEPTRDHPEGNKAREAPAAPAKPTGKAGDK